MISSNDGSILILTVNKEKSTVDDGRIMLDPNVLPTVCPICGSEGTGKQKLRIKAPYDWKFWIAIGGFLGVPILFGLCAVFISLIFGNQALQELLPYGVGIAIFFAAFGGLRMSGSNRENWFLTFYFCKQCEQQYKKLTLIHRLFGWGTILFLLAMLTVAVISPSLHFTEQSLQTIVWTMLIITIILFLIFIFKRIQRAIFRGLTAQWMFNKSSLKIKITNPHSLAEMKSKLFVKENQTQPVK